MTHRLYYDDAYCTEFDATVTATGQDSNGLWVKLDRSAFYPTSGGQPHDTGVLTYAGGTTRVVDVTVDHGEVLHYVQQALPPGTAVNGRIDWARRFDHMQQHLGEHLLAAEIARQTQGYTIGLHIGADDATIDVTLPDGDTRLSQEMWLRIEEAVNKHITGNLPVRCWFPTPQELAALPLRKEPTVDDHVRVVAAGEVEMVACGGTHPSTTGQVGLLKVLFDEPVRGKMRVHFVCGGRALQVFRTYQQAATETSRLLSSPVQEVPDAVQKLQQRMSDSEAALARLRRASAQAQLTDALQAVQPGQHGWRVLAHTVEEADMELLSQLAGDLVQASCVAVLLHGTAAGRDTYVFARSPQGSVDMAALLREVGLRGGGRPDFARGSAAQGDGQAILQAACDLAQQRMEEGERAR